MSMNAVGIDVSKRKSTVAILRPGGEVVASPFDVPHLSGCFQPLIQHIRALNGQTRIVMECTDVYKRQRLLHRELDARRHLFLRLLRNK